MGRRRWAHVCRDSSLQDPPPGVNAAEQDKEEIKNKLAAAQIGGGGGGGGEKLSDWTTSVLLFGIWAGLMYYVFQLAPNQTPVCYCSMGIYQLSTALHFGVLACSISDHPIASWLSNVVLSQRISIRLGLIGCYLVRRVYSW
jgi:hypothetical protein